MGKVTVDGVDLAEKTKEAMVKRHSVGMVFQYPEHQLFEETVAKDIAFGPRNQGCDEEETEKRVKSAMRFAGIDYETFAERSPFRLSGGQQRRVAIAGVIAMHPDFLILDEPSTYVDANFENEFYSVLGELNKTMSIVMVSHDLGTICSYVKTIACVNGGLHYHESNLITPEQLKLYNCPIELISHGTVPHRVLLKHDRTIEN